MIYWFVLIAFVIASLYAIFFFYSTIEWLKTRELHVLPNYKPVKFSIIIPFRDEVKNLEICLESILGQHYDRNNYEIILINDGSTDGSEGVVLLFKEKYQIIRLIQNSGSGKKDAIATGVEAAQYNHIITVDADTSRNREWLAAMATMYNYKGIKVVVGGILMIPRTMEVFHFFQAMDYCGSMTLSIVAMRKRWFRNGSGGNLAFTRDVYLKYASSHNDEGIISGDDVFLLQSAYREEPGCVLFPKIREILAFTTTEPDWSSFINQRNRWAGKSFHYKEWTMTILWAFIWLSNLLIPVILIFALSGHTIMIQLLCFTVMTKLLTDFIFLKSATNYFDKSFFKHFFIAELYHLSYVIIVGINAIFGKKSDWKGYKIKR